MRHIKLRAILSGLLVGATLVGLAYTANAADPPTPLARSGEIILQVPPGTALSVVKQLATNAGCDEAVRPLAYSPGVYLLGLKGRKLDAVPEVPTTELKAAIGKLRQNPGVTADPDYVRHFTDLPKNKTKVTRASLPPGAGITPNDPLFGQQWDMKMVRMPEAWNLQYSANPSVTTLVGIIDSGVESSHPDFIDSDGQPIVIDHQNFGGAVAGVDGVGHGTHVAGTVAAGTNNGNRVAGIAGWKRGGLNVRLLDVSVATPAGGVSSSGIIQAFNYCVTRGVKVINISIGGYFDASSERAAVKAAVDAGIVVCVSAGNGSIDHAVFPAYPADYPGVIKVTAIGHDKKLTWYSDYGFSENSQLIAAPGGSADGVESHDILSTYPLLGNPLIGPGNNGVISIAGTSMASPHVAGAAALLVAAGVPTNKVYQALADGAQLPGEPLDPYKHGPGVLDVYSALAPYSDRPPVASLDTAVGSGSSTGTPTSSLDRGASYFRATPIAITLAGVSRIYATAPAVDPGGLWSLESDVVVEIQSISRNPSVIKLTGGRNVAGQRDRFEIPTLAPGDLKGKSFPGVLVPAANTDGTYAPLSLPPGQYKIVSKLSLRDMTGIVSTMETYQFLTIIEKRLSAGRTMFALPFKAGIIQRPATQPNLTPEAGMLGSSAVFSLARYNPLRLPSDDDYARFRANDSYGLKSAARFDSKDQLDGRVVSYDTTLPGVSIAPVGLGYWLDLDRAEAIGTTLLPYPSQIAGVSPVAENAVAINAYATGGGWNMIGAPFTYPVDWSVVTVRVDGTSYSIAEAVKAGVISPALVGFRDGDYIYSIAPSGQLEPFEGYWVRVYRDCTLVVPPVASAAATRSQQARSSADGWRARLVASIGGDRDGQNYFGQIPGAADTEDGQDIPKPPSGAGHAYVRFTGVNAEGKSRALAFDMRSLNRNTVGRQEWTAEVATDRPNASVVLSWDGIRSAPRNSRLVLRDTVTGARVVMGSQSSYTYQSGEPGSSRKFVITLEPQASGGMLAIRNLRTVAGGRASGGWAVRFSTNAEAEVEGTITTLDGRTIGSLAGTGRSQAGTETVLRWDGRNKEGGQVAAGPYKVQIKARTADGQIQVEQRVIQIVR